MATTEFGQGRSWWPSDVVWIVFGMPDPKSTLPESSLCIYGLFFKSQSRGGRQTCISKCYCVGQILSFVQKETTDSLRGLGKSGGRTNAKGKHLPSLALPLKVLA